jgi:hypothetical protein
MKRLLRRRVSVFRNERGHLRADFCKPIGMRSEVDEEPTGVDACVDYAGKDNTEDELGFGREKH